MKSAVVFEVNPDSHILSVDNTVLLDSFEYGNWSTPGTYRILYSTQQHKQQDTAFNSIKDLILNKNAINLKSLGATHDITPVGSIEFVEKFLGKWIKAINVPPELRIPGICKREIWEGGEELVYQLLSHNKSPLFIKHALGVKKSEPILVRSNTPYTLPERCFISEYLGDIEAEWRVFVYNRRILDCRMYIGDWRSEIDKNLVQYVVKQYTNSPVAYTADFALLKTGETALIEIHNFISCGLYGFEDLVNLRHMVIRAYREERLK